MTIRTAVPDDADELAALVGERDGVELQTVPGARHWMVLDAPDGGLAAAMLVTMEGERAHLSLLAIAPPYEGAGIEERMLGVANALAGAFGCASLDVPDGAPAA